jgi:IS1 family transposase
VQLDELWANVKQAQQDLWVWVAVDARTKIIPVLQLGARTQEMAYAVVHELKNKLEVGAVPVFSTDGLKHYFYALTAHFGEWVHVEGQKKPIWMILTDFYYAQVIKRQRRRRMVEVEQRHIWGRTLGVQRPLEGQGSERKYQHGVCGASESPGTARQGRCNDPTGCLEIDAADVGEGAIQFGAFGASVLVDGLLSFCTGA